MWTTETKFWGFLQKVNSSQGLGVVWVSWALLSQEHLSKAQGRINPIRILSLLLSYCSWLDHTQRLLPGLEPGGCPLRLLLPLPKVTVSHFFKLKVKLDRCLKQWQFKGRWHVGLLKVKVFLVGLENLFIHSIFYFTVTSCNLKIYVHTHTHTHICLYL